MTVRQFVEAFDLIRNGQVHLSTDPIFQAVFERMDDETLDQEVNPAELARIFQESDRYRAHARYR